ncbi:MAG TPA: DoxX family protein [Planctomycetaceae bacterium]|jgi:uncharacterized membrane protein YphA (DoxX/SURF4 family)|nr:DoxX family protein [Planctomycetaceae bacterium]
MMTNASVPAAPSLGQIIAYWSRTIGYWATTLLVAFLMATGGAFLLWRPPQLIEIMTRLSYPAYLCVILGVWKVLGAVALLLPRTPRLKEWAYAGTFFELTGAAASHYAAGHRVDDITIPLFIALIAVASWALRPPSRRLAGPIL